ncbi:MAG TPA: DUF2851 family protein, partial [Chloroflexia bacterium]|nr:DUF2851 family protein [Chloroflexia bacterium]
RAPGAQPGGPRGRHARGMGTWARGDTRTAPVQPTGANPMCLLTQDPDRARLAEEPPAELAEPLPLAERTLAAIWNAQRPLAGPFWTTAHEPVAVLYRGQWTGGAGPDFHGAIVAFGAERPRRGDVELHLRAADWYAHGHHQDPAYNDVLLHVVYTLGGGASGPVPLHDARRARTAAGREVPTLVLAPHITADPAGLATLQWPERLGDLSEEPCWQRTQHRPLADLQALLAEAGDRRFADKSAQFEAALAVALDGVPHHDRESAAEEVLYAGLCDALGYSANRAPFRALAARMPLALLRVLGGDRPAADRTALLEAALLGAAGLLPTQRQLARTLDWESAAQAEELEGQWAALRPLLSHVLAGDAPPAWKFAGVRPPNAPARRVAALAHLLSWMLPGGLLAGFLADRPAALAPADQGARWLRRLQLAAPGGFWSEHSDFGVSLGTAHGADLIGADRAAEMLVNIVLPFLDAWAVTTDDAPLTATARAVYAALPGQAGNAITRAMTGEVFGPRAKAARLAACEQQGLLGLHSRYCAVRDVYGCPLSGVVGRVEK